jgi:hypothetical protein
MFLCVFCQTVFVDDMLYEKEETKQDWENIFPHYYWMNHLDGFEKSIIFNFIEFYDGSCLWDISPCVNLCRLKLVDSASNKLKEKLQIFCASVLYSYPVYSEEDTICTILVESIHTTDRTICDKATIHRTLKLSLAIIN